jgi:hypothetical protein
MRAHLVRGVLALVLATACAACSSSGSSDNPSANPASPTTTTTGTIGSLTTVVDTTQIAVTDSYTMTWNWAGQSVTIPAGMTIDNVRFNWFATSGTGPVTDTSSQKPAAFGTLYILNAEYLGVPGGLPSAPGFVAKSSSIVDGQYVFASGVKLTAGKYWFYTDTQGAFVTGFFKDTYTGGDLYVTGYFSNPFRKAQASWRVIDFGPPIVYEKPPEGTMIDANFKLQGTASK